LMLARKGFNSFITLLLVTVMNFFLFRVIPGDPLMRLRDNPRLTPDFKQKMIEQFGLDQDLLTQFYHYITNVFTLDFGNSFTQQLTPAMDVILGYLKWTLILTGTSSILMIVIGMTIGVFAAYKRGSAFDTGSLAFSLFFYAMPTFWLAMMLIVLFATGGLKWFPSDSAMTYGVPLELTFTSIMDMLHHLMLPALSLTLGSINAGSMR